MLWKSETTTTEGETLTHWSFAVHFCSLRLFIYCLKMQTLLLVSLPSVSPIFFPFYTIRMRIDEIFAYWRDEYKHLINPARECVCVCIRLTFVHHHHHHRSDCEKKNTGCVTPPLLRVICIHSSPIFSLSFFLCSITRRTTKLIVQGKKMRVQDIHLRIHFCAHLTVFYRMTDRFMQKIFFFVLF